MYREEKAVRDEVERIPKIEKGLRSSDRRGEEELQHFDTGFSFFPTSRQIIYVPMNAKAKGHVLRRRLPVQNECSAKGFQ